MSTNQYRKKKHYNIAWTAKGQPVRHGRFQIGQLKFMFKSKVTPTSHLKYEELVVHLALCGCPIKSSSGSMNKAGDMGPLIR